jgi:SAM-dependent methyltransferase
VTDPVLEEQREYYEQRAAEYDDWWLRRGRYDQGPEENARWAAEGAEVRAALDRLDVHGDVLELAPGTGQWSRLLLPRCETLTLVDGSPAMLAHNPAAWLDGARSARVPDPRTRSVVADLFEWTTDARFDVVAFGFWLSHVPERLLGDFLARVGTWLRPGGRLFYVDSRPYASRVSPALIATDGERHTRSLADGREFAIVKVFRTAEALTAAFAAAGIDADVRETASLFQYATGIRNFRQ